MALETRVFLTLFLLKHQEKCGLMLEEKQGSGLAEPWEDLLATFIMLIIHNLHSYIWLVFLIWPLCIPMAKSVKQIKITVISSYVGERY